MPIRCSACGAEGQHFTFQCPQNGTAGKSKDSGLSACTHISDRAARVMEKSKGGVNESIDGKGTGRKAGKGSEGKVSTSAQLQKEAQARDKAPQIIYEHDDGPRCKALLHAFLCLKPSSIDWAIFGTLGAHLKLRNSIPQPSRVTSETGRLVELQNAWSDFSSRGVVSPKEARLKLCGLAELHGITSAKWMFFLPPAELDVVWPGLVRLLVDGQLGHSMKVQGGASFDKSMLCCVYMRNFMDSADVHRVRDALAKRLSTLLGSTLKIMLKPDVYTYCGIYSRNQWNLPCHVDELKVKPQRRQDTVDYEVGELRSFVEAITSGKLETVALRQSLGDVAKRLHTLVLLGRPVWLDPVDICDELVTKFPVQTWEIHVEKPAQGRLGFFSKKNSPSMAASRTVEKIDGNGVIWQFNRDHPDKAIRSSDVISHANCFRDNIWGEGGEVRNATSLTLEVQRSGAHLLVCLENISRYMARALTSPRHDWFFHPRYRSDIFCQLAYEEMHLNNITFLADLCVRGLVKSDAVVGILEILLSPPTKHRECTRASWCFISKCVRTLLAKTSSLPVSSPFSLPQFMDDVVEPRLALAKDPLGRPVRILTFNLWFSSEEREARTAALITAIHALKPTICCFQEVVPSVAAAILQALPSWMSSDPGDGSSVHDYGILGLVEPGVQAHFSCRTLPTTMDRELLIIEVPGLAVGGVHLESLDNQHIRDCQLAICADALAQFSNTLLVGDFNFDSERNFKPPHTPLNNDVLQRALPDYVDIWPALKRDRGCTFVKKKKQMRYDRVLARLDSWRCTAIDIVFMEKMDLGASFLPLYPSMRSNYVDLDVSKFEQVRLSDHYGLLAVVECL